MDLLKALLAAIIQGVTEFLPVSSSGHLVIFNALFGESDGNDLTYTVFLHLATLLSVIIVFRKDVWGLIRTFFEAAGDILKRKPNFRTPERRFLLMVIVATIPAALIGFAIKLMHLDDILENIFVVAAMLVVTSVFMFMTDKLSRTGKYSEEDAPMRSAWLVGALQAAAILPGLSRSGSAIFGGLLGGYKKEFAVKFAFIISIPIIVGAGVAEIPGVIRADTISINPMIWLTGFIVATITGIFAIRLIRLLMRNSKFYLFGIYCLIISAIALLVGTGIL